MIIKVLLRLPLLHKNEPPLIEDVGMEFIPGAPRLCMNKGNDLFHLINKILVICRMNPAPG